MKKHLVLCILCTLCCVTYAQKIKIKTGIEVLKEQNFKCLEGKRVGLITNPTGVDNHMKSTIDILHEAPNVNLAAAHSPTSVPWDLPWKPLPRTTRNLSYWIAPIP